MTKKCVTHQNIFPVSFSKHCGQIPPLCWNLKFNPQPLDSLNTHIFWWSCFRLSVHSKKLLPLISHGNRWCTNSDTATWARGLLGSIEAMVSSLNELWYQREQHNHILSVTAIIRVTSDWTTQLQNYKQPISTHILRCKFAKGEKGKSLLIYKILVGLRIVNLLIYFTFCFESVQI